MIEHLVREDHSARQDIPVRLTIPLENYHQHQGNTNDCAPFTAAMVISALNGRHVDGRELAQEMNRPRWRWTPLPHPLVRRLPGWATFPWGVVDVLKLHGIPARWSFGAREADLLAALRDGRIAMPIVGGWRPIWAHIKPLVAHDPGRGWAFVDPGHKIPLAWHSYEGFRREWRNWGNLLVETV